MNRARVLLADDHPLMLEGLRKLLEPDFAVAGAMTDGCALLEAAQRQPPDLVITDISMPGLDGIEVARRLRRSLPAVRILILSIHSEPSWVQAAFGAGAHGYLSKCSAPEEIEVAVRELLKGNFYISPALTGALVGAAVRGPERSPEPQPPSSSLLTHREMEIVRLVGLGMSNKEIAKQLGVSISTVRTHLGNIHEKLGSTTRVELALLAAQGGEAVM